MTSPSPAELVSRLRQWTVDWNGEQMVRGTTPRDGLHCDILLDAASMIEALVKERDEALFSVLSRNLGENAFTRGYKAGLEAGAKWHDDCANNFRSITKGDVMAAQKAYALNLMLVHESSAAAIRALPVPEEG